MPTIKSKFNAGEFAPCALDSDLSSFLAVGHKVALVAMAVILVIMFIIAFLYSQEIPRGVMLRYALGQANSQTVNSMGGSTGPEMSGGTPRSMAAMGMLTGDNASIHVIVELMRRLQETPKDSCLQYELGKEFLKAGNYVVAQSFFTQVLVVKPSDVNLLSLLGMCLVGQDNCPEAVTYYEQIAVLEPDNAAA